MRSDDDLGEEMLLSGGWSRRTIGGIAVAGLAVVAGLVVGLTHGGDGMSSARRPASSSQPTTLRLTTAPPGLVPGNNVLDLSLIGGEAVASSPAAPGRWTLTVSSDLTNYASRPLGIDGPLTVSGAGRGVVVKVAELAASRYAAVLNQPPALTVIRPAATVELWLELTLDCRTPAPHRSLREVAVMIPLSGTSAPAQFYLADLTSGFQYIKPPASC